MAATALQPQPTGITPWIQRTDKDGRLIPNEGLPSFIFLNYMLALDTVVRNSVFGPLTNAANDVAAAAAGVPINGLYRNGNAVQIRLT